MPCLARGHGTITHIHRRFGVDLSCTTTSHRLLLVSLKVGSSLSVGVLPPFPNSTLAKTGKPGVANFAEVGQICQSWYSACVSKPGFQLQISRPLVSLSWRGTPATPERHSKPETDWGGTSSSREPREEDLPNADGELDPAKLRFHSCKTLVNASCHLWLGCAKTDLNKKYKI